MLKFINTIADKQVHIAEWIYWCIRQFIPWVSPLPVILPALSKAVYVTVSKSYLVVPIPRRSDPRVCRVRNTAQSECLGANQCGRSLLGVYRWIQAGFVGCNNRSFRLVDLQR